ncbi:hypothetical protein M0R45_020017 [Rubus argutus]|uniref:protein-tyrosine-phosphatase n=1 Tax=Rubus argutus TaxID=59490 RepID=A0AAW1X7M5_RUBAR
MNQVDDSPRSQAAAVLQSMNDRFSTWDNVPCKIEEGLFFGSIGAANNKEELKKLNVTHILTVANSLPLKYPNDFVYEVLNVMDTECTNLQQHFDECFKFIADDKTSGGGVLVHLFVGKQEAPNAGFISQLQDFERSLQGSL